MGLTDRLLLAAPVTKRTATPASPSHAETLTNSSGTTNNSARSTRWKSQIIFLFRRGYPTHSAQLLSDSMRMIAPADAAATPVHRGIR